MTTVPSPEDYDDLTFVLIHDVRGPLGSMITGVTLVQEMLNDPQQAQDKAMIAQILEIALESGMMLMKLINSYLDAATPNPLLSRYPTPLSELAQSALPAVERAFSEANVTLQIDLPDTLILLDVDSEKIRRVLVNLLENALHFTPDGGKVYLEMRPDGDKVLVRVADSGAGIAPDEREIIFLKFWRSKTVEPVRRHVGMGMGLPFCRLILEAHGEKIWVEARGPLAGACVAFTLPVAQ